MAWFVNDHDDSEILMKNEKKKTTPPIIITNLSFVKGRKLKSYCLIFICVQN